MARRRRTLLDALILLDAYARQNVPSYEESNVAGTVVSMIEKAQARGRHKFKRIIPLEGQLDMEDRFDQVTSELDCRR